MRSRSESNLPATARSKPVVAHYRRQEIDFMKKLLIFFLILIVQSSFLLGQESKISLFVSPDTSLYHKPLKIEVTGTEPREQITIQVKAIDAEGNKWISSAAFVTDEFGKVNPAKSEALNGSYTGIYPMGLFWSMKSNDDHQIATGQGYTATISVLVSNSTVASKTVYRRSTRELDALWIHQGQGWFAASGL